MCLCMQPLKPLNPGFQHCALKHLQSSPHCAGPGGLLLDPEALSATAFPVLLLQLRSHHWYHVP